MTDITLLTDSRYVNPKEINWYIQNILDDDHLLRTALEKRGLRVDRTNWDNAGYNWNNTRYALFRTTWDYFDRYGEFLQWLDVVTAKTKLINSIELVRWNIDKHYLWDLQNKGIAIPPTLFIEPRDGRSLTEIVNDSGWNECILKPAVSGAARHTYRLHPENIEKHEAIFRKLIMDESLLLQEFQHPVIEKGEVAYMLFNGQYSHAVLKKAKPGDFRVQDDFGGTVHDYSPTREEIAFAEEVIAVCQPRPVYARVDVIWDNTNRLCVSELELIEPELWLRKNHLSAERFAEALVRVM
jgi:glutathione synthase/RimK-type ligase-like ATP-grasp enzyme